MMKRIFLAVNLPKGVKSELLEYQSKWPELPARWTKPENLHVTLVFLGNTSDEELQELQRIVKKVALRHKPFSLHVKKVVYGPTQKQPRMLWATGTAPEELFFLQSDLARAIGHQDEHPFSLHLTLARFNEWKFRQIEPEERPHVNEEINMEIPVQSIEIMESKLKRTGAEYSIVESIPLKT